MPRRHLFPRHRSVLWAHSFLAAMAPDPGDIDSHRETPSPRPNSMASGPHARPSAEHSRTAGELDRSRSRIAALTLSRQNLLRPLPLARACAAGGGFRGRARSPSLPSARTMEFVGNSGVRLPKPVPARTSHDPLGATIKRNQLLGGTHLLVPFSPDLSTPGV